MSTVRCVICHEALDTRQMAGDAIETVILADGTVRCCDHSDEAEANALGFVAPSGQFRLPSGAVVAVDRAGIDPELYPTDVVAEFDAIETVILADGTAIS